MQMENEYFKNRFNLVNAYLTGQEAPKLKIKATTTEVLTMHTEKGEGEGDEKRMSIKTLNCR